MFDAHLFSQIPDGGSDLLELDLMLSPNGIESMCFDQIDERQQALFRVRENDYGMEEASAPPRQWVVAAPDP
jgi:hypothetical protein